MRMTPLLRMTALVVISYLTSAGPALADAVTHWNGIAQTAIAAGRPGPPVGTLDSALVQAAVHDAVQSIVGKFEPYKVTIEGASGSPAAAAAAAAHGVLIGLYGATQAATLNAAWAAFLLANPDLVGDPGIAVGQQVATQMLTFYRPADPSNVFNGCLDDPPCDPGEWRPTPNYIGTPPPPPATMFAPWLAEIEPFTLISGRQFRAAPPPRLTSQRYLRDYNEVKALGSFANTPCVDCGHFEGASRTADQTAQAYFWSENFLAQWNRALRAIAEAHIDKIADSARLFALANLSAADAAITAWDSKVLYNFWRPITAIQEGDNDGNHRTGGDPNWQSLINNPAYPEYTSGANNLTGAFTRTLKLFFGTDHFEFKVTSNAPQLGAPDDARRTRSFSRFSDAAQDVVEARILLGIHFRFADTAARTQGQRVARWAFKHFLLPVHDHDNCDHDDH